MSNILEKDELNKLSWEVESFFWRLNYLSQIEREISRDPRILRAKLYPLLLSRVREADIERCIQTCIAAGIVRFVGSPPDQTIEIMRPKVPISDIFIGNKRVTRIVKTKDIPEQAFLSFWTAYPRREAKKKAYQVWIKNDCEAHLAAILEDIESRLKSKRWKTDTEEDLHFIPLPSTYLVGQRWTDENESTRRKAIADKKMASKLQTLLQRKEWITAGLSPCHGKTWDETDKCSDRYCYEYKKEKLDIELNLKSI